jgi:hypothetical protein
MLSLFRRFRKKLLHSGTTRKYLTYAIGEIALIVIGILIALQINNWNEWRKDRQKENQYLLSLKSEFERNFVHVKDQIEMHKLQCWNAEFIIMNIAGDTILKDALPLAIALEQVSYRYPINFATNVWEELVTTGNISLIQNEDFKRLITGFYGDLEFTLELEKEFHTYYLRFQQIVGNIFAAQIWVAITDLIQDKSDNDIVFTLPAYQEIVMKLRGLDALNGSLARVLSSRKHGLDMFIEYEERIKEITKEIESKIEN